MNQKARTLAVLSLSLPLFWPALVSAQTAPAGGLAPPTAEVLTAPDAEKRVELAERLQAVSDKQVEAVKKTAEETEKQTATRKFAGLDFGVGIGVTLTGDDKRVDQAELAPAMTVPAMGEQAAAPALVRVKSRRNNTARVFLESHYFFTIGDRDLFGTGPFIALQPGTDEIIQAAGIGWMVGARRKEAESASFNLGVGIVLEPNVRTLGDGIVPNEPLPPGETVIRYQEKSLTSFLLLGSFSF